MLEQTRKNTAYSDYSPLTADFADLTVGETPVRISYMRRHGPRAPLLILHGFGSTKEDYADLALHPHFAGRDLVAFDAPGCGASEIGELSTLSMPLVAETAAVLADRLDLTRFHLIGHSMGGLAALLLASERPQAIISISNIEGNLAPEDCFFSRQLLNHPAEDADVFLDGFIERTWQTHSASSALYASALRQKVRAGATKPLFRSIVELSDGGDLLKRFLSLQCPKLFVYGEENRDLSYLPSLHKSDVAVAEISQSGHFPMYSNPVRLWAVLAEFIDAAESERADAAC